MPHRAGFSLQQFILCLCVTFLVCAFIDPTWARVRLQPSVVESDQAYLATLENIRMDISELLQVDRSVVPFEVAALGQSDADEFSGQLYDYVTNSIVLITLFLEYEGMDAMDEFRHLWERTAMPGIRIEAVTRLHANGRINKDDVHELHQLLQKLVDSNPIDRHICDILRIVEATVWGSDKVQQGWLDDTEKRKYLTTVLRLLEVEGIPVVTRRFALSNLLKAAREGIAPSYALVEKLVEDWDSATVANAIPLLAAAVSLEETDEGRQQREGFFEIVKERMTQANMGENVVTTALTAITNKHFDGHREKAASLLPLLRNVALNQQPGMHYSLNERRAAVRGISSYVYFEDALKALDAIMRVGELDLFYTAVHGIAASQVARLGSEPLLTIEKIALNVEPVAVLSSISESGNPDTYVTYATEALAAWRKKRGKSSADTAVLATRARKAIAEHRSDPRRRKWLGYLSYSNLFSGAENRANRGFLIGILEDEKELPDFHAAALNILRRYPESMETYARHATRLLKLPSSALGAKLAKDNVLRQITQYLSPAQLLLLKAEGLMDEVTALHQAELENLKRVLEELPLEEGLTRREVDRRQHARTSADRAVRVLEKVLASLGGPAAERPAAASVYYGLKLAANDDEKREHIETLKDAVTDAHNVEGQILRKAIETFSAPGLDEEDVETAYDVSESLRMLMTQESMQLLIWLAYKHPIVIFRQQAGNALVQALAQIAPGNLGVLGEETVDGSELLTWLCKWYQVTFAEPLMAAKIAETQGEGYEWKSPFGMDLVVDQLEAMPLPDSDE